MRNQSILRWLIRTAATIFAITILSTLGAAVFGLLCGALCWVLRVERVPIGFLWITVSGATAGFLVGSLWALDRIMNWRIYLSLSQDEARSSIMTSLYGKALQQTTLNELLKKAAENEAPTSGPLSCPSTLKSSRWSQES